MSFRTSQIRKRILETLKPARGFAVPEETIRSYVDALERPPVTDQEWSDAMVFLVAGKTIVAVDNDLDPDILQYAITEKGRTLLASL